jgi:alpha-galactosidase
VWFQGFNDMVDDGAYPDRMKPGGYAEYTSLLTQLVKDVRKDLSAPKLPFVIGEMGVGGNREGAKPPQLNFRLAEHLPSMPGVVTVKTSPFWDDDLEDLQQKQERKGVLTPEEVGRLKAVSNGGYHYLGAAKILAPIGVAFAEALLHMR